MGQVANLVGRRTCSDIMGGSTGMNYFRPKGARYEAKDIRVEGCVFVGSDAPVAFTGVDGATFRYNTIYRPASSKPQLPAAETGGVYGVDPKLAAPDRNQFQPQDPKAARFGASA